MKTLGRGSSPGIFECGISARTAELVENQFRGTCGIATFPKPRLIGTVKTLSGIDHIDITIIKLSMRVFLSIYV